MDMGQNRYQENGDNWDEIIMENSKKNYAREKKYKKNWINLKNVYFSK